MPYLRLENLEKGGKWDQSVDADSFLIGRSRNAQVRIRDTSVSKEHVRIEKRGLRYHFRDLGSRNGTLVNEFRSDQGALSDGDEIRLGRIRITFYRQPPSREIAGAQIGGAPDELALDPAPAIGLDSDADTMTFAPPVEDEPLEARAASPRRPERLGAPAAVDSRRSRRWAEVSAKPARARRRWLRIAAVFALGLAIGYTATHLSRRGAEPGDAAAVPEARGTADPTPESESTAGAPANGTSGTAAQPVAAAIPAGDPALALLCGPPADLRDVEASTRALFRLFLDVLGRSPTRAEVAEHLPLPHDVRWSRVGEIAARAPETALPTTEAALVDRFLGRPARAAEAERLRAAAASDPRQIGALIASSSLYASRDFQRRKSPSQHARSLWIDFLDSPPTAQNIDTLLAAMRDATSSQLEMLRILGHARSASAQGPKSAEAAAEWVREAFLRFLLRLPTREESDEAAATVARDKDGWRWVLLSLAQREDYRYY